MQENNQFCYQISLKIPKKSETSKKKSKNVKFLTKNSKNNPKIIKIFTHFSKYSKSKKYTVVQPSWIKKITISQEHREKKEIEFTNTRRTTITFFVKIEEKSQKSQKFQKCTNCDHFFPKPIKSGKFRNLTKNTHII